MKKTKLFKEICIVRFLFFYVIKKLQKTIIYRKDLKGEKNERKGNV